MEDRLAEFKKLGGVSVSSTPQPTDTSQALIPQFSSKVKLLQQALNQVKFNNEEILRLKDKHAAATLNEQEKKISDELNRLIDQNNALCKTVKDQLALLQTEVEESKKNEPDEPETRAKIINYQALSSKFSDIIKESQNVQLEFKASVKSKIGRQAKIVDSSLTDAQVEEITNDPEGAAKLLSSKMLGAGHTKLQNAVSDIQDKYKDILKLERSVEIMHQMFVDMSILVHAQGQVIDSIALNLSEARSYVHKGVGKLGDAQTSHKKSRTLQCYILICIILGVTILLFMTGVL
jgi:t-SNARE complex subunit (syntaxin)